MFTVRGKLVLVIDRAHVAPPIGGVFAREDVRESVGEIMCRYGAFTRVDPDRSAECERIFAALSQRFHVETRVLTTPDLNLGDVVAVVRPVCGDNLLEHPVPEIANMAWNIRYYRVTRPIPL